MTGRTTIPKIGLMFATPHEAESFLKISRAVLRDDTAFTLYDISLNLPALVIISGIGKIAAAAACQYLIHEHGVGHVINAGVCGTLRTEDRFLPGNLFRISAVVEGDHGTQDRSAPESQCPTHWADQLPEARLVTCDRPVFDLHLREELAFKGDLVDMEGAAVARVADLFDIPWTLIKAVTDNAGPNDREILLKNIATASSTLARFLWSQMTTAWEV